jgi:hypothetical protein
MVRPKSLWTSRVAISAALALAVLHPIDAAGPTSSREISFEQRVEAQRAIERVYHSHQIDAPPFETLYRPRRSGHPGRS